MQWHRCHGIDAIRRGWEREWGAVPALVFVPGYSPDGADPLVLPGRQSFAREQTPIACGL